MKPTKLLIFVLALCGGLALLTGCSDDESPTAPTPVPEPMVNLTWQAHYLNVIQDCDAGTSRAAGDFYISFKLSDVTDGGDVVLAEKSKVLIKANTGEYLHADDLGIALTSEMPLKDGARVLLRMSIYENDTNGPQVSIGNGYHYTYSTVSNRWESEWDDGGMTFGVSDSATLHLEDNAGDACQVYLGGRFSQDLILE